MLIPLAFSLHAVVRGVHVFIDHLTDVRWSFLAVVAVLQVIKIGCAARAWQNSIVASYPKKSTSFPMTFGALSAGVAVGSVIPAHGGDAVRVVIVKRRLRGSTYTTLASTILVRAPFDTLMAGLFFLFLFQQGVLPGHALLPHRPAFDFSWFFGHPKQTIIILSTVVLILTALTLWAWVTIREFKERVRQGLAGLLDWRFYFRHIFPWQLGDWALRLAIVFFALLAFHMPASFHNSLLAQGTSNLATLLPISPSGIGTEQALLVTVLHGAASSSMIVAYSVGTRLITSAINIVLGFGAILFFFHTFRFQRFVTQEQGRSGSAPKARKPRSPGS
ncbi:MAG: lysylphosphatidylglycerol synthase transmembrane domain-containing protein [Gaiellaceae bacterium]